MASVPKFQACGQRWSDMTPVQGGRMCDECNKKVVDLTRKRWKQIERLHAQQPGVCGMYTPTQVQHWGQEIPSNSVCSKALAVTSMMLALAGVPLTSQSQTVTEVEVKFDSTKALPENPIPAVEEKKATVTQTADSSLRTIFKGFVRDKDTGSPVGFTPVVIMSNGSQVGGGCSDDNGYFEIDLTNYMTENTSLSIKTTFLGYSPVELELDDSCFQKTTEINLEMTRVVNGLVQILNPVGLISYEPTPMQRIRHKMFNLLRRFKY
jgi:hypothetical protein